MNPSFEKLTQRMNQANSLLCVGLDSTIEKIPARFQNEPTPQFAFNRWVIEQTHLYVCAYKPNLAFYEARGDQGWRELKQTMDYLRDQYPDIFTIADAKRADIGSTNAGYVTAIFDWLGFDAVTLNPYLGKEALLPFLERTDKTNILLCRTSNPGAGEFQDLRIGEKTLWQVVAERVCTEWNTASNCMLVVGATYPAELKQVRAMVGEMTLLVPGIGTQGGDVELVLKVGLNENKQGLILNASRSIIFAANPSIEAQNLRDEINQYR
ncbi:MAG: orotidine-5'-phosphate decarboxylase [Chloroflexi bacterium]|nr:orotidine-5'-phosphate decarboxylase [Chloroflexota bacterium]